MQKIRGMCMTVLGRQVIPARAPPLSPTGDRFRAHHAGRASGCFVLIASFVFVRFLCLVADLVHLIDLLPISFLSSFFFLLGLMLCGGSMLSVWALSCLFAFRACSVRSGRTLHLRNVGPPNPEHVINFNFSFLSVFFLWCYLIVSDIYHKKKTASLHLTALLTFFFFAVY